MVACHIQCCGRDACMLLLQSFKLFAQWHPHLLMWESFQLDQLDVLRKDSVEHRRQWI